MSISLAHEPEPVELPAWAEPGIFYGRLTSRQWVWSRRLRHGWHTQAQWEAKIDEWYGLCAICMNPCPRTPPGTPNHLVEPTRDHIIPTSRGGRDDIGNIQPAHRACNARKCDRIGYTPWEGRR